MNGNIPKKIQCTAVRPELVEGSYMDFCKKLGDMIYLSVKTGFPLRIAMGMTELGLLQDAPWISSTVIRDVDVVFSGSRRSASGCPQTFPDLPGKIIFPTADTVQIHDIVSLRSEAFVSGPT
ncbi:MAG: hypothetical protein M0R70_06770 [Nitrospirae bacterium]|nr:hypothetical protein [Nitrospirota bacterium]